MRFWNDGQLRHNYNTDDMEHRVPELVEFASTIMTLNTGDLIACGTNHEGLGALQDGETVEIEIERIGRMSLKVADPLKRSWERGVYMGADFDQPRGRQAPPAEQLSNLRRVAPLFGTRAPPPHAPGRIGMTCFRQVAGCLDRVWLGRYPRVMRARLFLRILACLVMAA